MSNIYKVGIQLAMTTNAGQVLGALSRQLLHVNANANALVGTMSRVRVAVVGALSMTAGVGLLRGLAQMTDKAKELSHQLVQIQKMNVTGDRLQDVRVAARAATTKVPGTTEVDALKSYGATYSIFGHGDSLKMIQPLLKFAQVLGNTSGDYKGASDKLYEMIRAGDLMGKFVDHITHKVDVNRLTKFLELGAKTTLATHGKVSPSTWLALAQQGGPALSEMSDKGLITMAMVSQMMGGHRAGTALTALYQQMIGGKMTKSAATKLNELGMVGGFDVGRGGHVSFKKGALDTPFARALKDDPLVAIQILEKQMKTKGLKEIGQQVPYLFEILGRQTTQRIVHDILRNLPQMIGERERIMDAKGIDESKKLQDEKDYTQVLQNLKASWDNLMLAFAGPNSETAIGIMTKLTGVFNSMTETVRGMDPETLKNIGIGLGILGAALVGGGAIALMAALGSAGWIATGIIGLSTAVVTYWPAIQEAWNSFANLLPAAGTKIAEDLNNITTALSNVATSIGNEIRSWPSRLAEAIASMGNAIIEMIKRVFNSLNPFSRTSLDGGGEGGAGGGGFGGMLHKASLGGGGGAGAGGGRGGGGGGFGAGGGGPLIPGNPGGLQVKGAQASGGGPAAAGIYDLAKDIQGLGGVQKFSAFNDHFHKHRGGMHPKGLAFDVTGNAGQIITNLKKRMAEAGLVQGRDYKYINEYTHPSRGSTGGHIHFQFQNNDAANRYRQHRLQQQKPAPPKISAPPKHDQEVNVQVPVYIGGDKIAHTVSKQMARAGRYPNSIGGQDTRGSHRSPGTRVTDAA